MILIFFLISNINVLYRVFINIIFIITKFCNKYENNLNLIKKKIINIRIKLKELENDYE